MLKKYIDAFINIFFPSLCLACEKKIKNSVLCQECLLKINYINPPVCRYCLRSINHSHNAICSKCQSGVFPYKMILAATHYQGPMIKLIQLFKYQHYDWLASFLAELMAREFKKQGFKPGGYDFLTAVPLHRYKGKIRGYNQAKLLAEGLSKYFKIPYSVVINKWDINKELSKKIESWAGNNFLGEISYDKEIFKAVSKLTPIMRTNLKAKEEIIKIYKNLNKKLFLWQNQNQLH